MKKYSCFIIIWLLSISSFAQNNNHNKYGYFNLSEIGFSYGSGNKEYEFSPKQFVSSINTATVFSIRNVNGFYINPHLSIGVGLGYERISIKEGKTTMINNDGLQETVIIPSQFYNTLPLFADLRYYFTKSSNSWFVYGDVGSSIEISNKFNKGFYWGTGVGYKFSVTEFYALNVNLGFNEQYITNSDTNKERIPRLGLRIGLIF